MELAVVTNSKNGTTIVGGRLISRAVHGFSGDYGDDVINALVLGTKDGDAVRQSLAVDGAIIIGGPEDITAVGFDFNNGLQATLLSQKMSNILENLTSIQFARQGEIVIQGPTPAQMAGRGVVPPNPDKDPDLLFDQIPEIADIINVSTPTASSAIQSALGKVVDGQAQRIVINLDRSPLDAAALQSVLNQIEPRTGRTWLDVIENGAPNISQFDPATLVSRIDVLDGSSISTLYVRG